MSKRKQDSDSESDVSLIDVDFDFFNPNPDVDYHALKRLIVQLFQRDADRFSPHDLAELILSQPGIGTTIKTDGQDSDPYAIVTVLNMHVHKDHPSVKALAAYCLEKSSPNAALHGDLQALFSQTEKHVGFIFCERLINMPVQVIPPMYRMLGEELQNAANLNEPFAFSHFIVISRTYHLSDAEESHLSATSNKPRKTKKSKTKIPSAPNILRPTDGMYSFHPEDELIKASGQFVDYAFSSAPTGPRDSESFGLDTRGRLMLVATEKFGPLVDGMLKTYAVE